MCMIMCIHMCIKYTHRRFRLPAPPPLNLAFIDKTGMAHTQACGDKLQECTTLLEPKCNVLLAGPESRAIGHSVGTTPIHQKGSVF